MTAVLLLTGLAATACTVPPEDFDPPASSPSLTHSRNTLGQSSSGACTFSEKKVSAPSTTSNPPQALGFGLEDFAGLLRDGAIDYAESEGIGWALDLILGGDKSQAAEDRKLDDIQKEVDQTQKEVEQLNENLDALCEQLSKDSEQIQKNQEWTDYQTSLAAADEPIDALKTYSRELRVMFSRPVSNPSDPSSGMSDQDKHDLLAMRDATRKAVDQLGLALYPDASSGKQGIIRSYKKVLESDIEHPTDGSVAVVPPSKNNLYSNAYVDPMSNLMNYYSNIMLSTLDLLSESYHADFMTADGSHYPSDPKEVSQFVDAGLSYVDSWNMLAFRGIGGIPKDTVVDTNTSPFTMWTQHPVSLTEDPQATSSCYDPAAFCFANVYDSDGKILDSALLPRTDQQLSERLAAKRWEGLDDWRAPIFDELYGLISRSNEALPQWAAKQGLQQFVPRNITSHLNGSVRQQTVVGPFLVGTTTDGKRTGATVLESPDASRQGLSLTGRAQGQNQDGGLLLLVRDANVSKLCTGACAKQPAAQKISAARHPKFPKLARRVTPPKLTKQATRLSAPEIKAPAAAVLDQPTTYDQPTTCANGPTYTVAHGANAVRVTIAGGVGGAGKLEGSTSGQPGGRGGSITTVVPAKEGSTLRIQVGGQGGDTNAGAAGGGAGGGTVPASGLDAKPGSHSGGGGGASGLATDDRCTFWLAVAGGGGGGGSAWSSGGISAAGSWHGGRGGDACPLPAVPGTSCNAAASGQDSYPDHKLGTAGGTPPSNTGGHSRDGHSAVGGDGSDLVGGGGARGDSAGGGGGGGGGGGYYGGGGGGGGGYRAGGGGGGGGASFVVPGVITDQTVQSFNNQAGSVTITSITR